MSIGRVTAICVILIASDPTFRVRGELAPPDSGAAGSQADPPRKILPLTDDDDDQPKAPGAQTSTQPPEKYLFGLINRRSSDGQDFFPDPFLGPEFDRETQIEFDYAHGETRNQQANEAGAQLEWNFIGQFTLAGEFGYDSEHEKNARSGRDGNGAEQVNARGFENVDLAVFHPIFRAVSEEEAFDYSAVLRLDVGIPTRTAVSGTDVQLTPYLGQLLRVGEHVSVEAWTGPQFTIAPHPVDQFIYGASFGYKIAHNQVALPLTKSVTPLFEIDGQTPFSSHGQDALFGVAGGAWQFAAFGELHPRVGFGYQFPLDRGAREQLHWGIIAQVFLDF